MIEITSTITIDENDIQERFIRASGPGGQHVNKTSTAVQVQLDINRIEGLPGGVRTRLAVIAGNRLNPEGVLTISVQSHRSQYLNRQEAVERLVAMIRQATVKPKRRRATKPTKASKERRLIQKKSRGGVKALRKKVKGED